MGRLALIVAVVGLYGVHQDVWFWRQTRPFVFGFLPVGLAYHAAYCAAVSVLMWALTRYAWPAHLDTADDEAGPGPVPGARGPAR